MSKAKTIRAWKDPVYRASLSASEQAALPPCPAGAIELTQQEMQAVSGGTVTTNTFFTTCCACGIKALAPSGSLKLRAMTATFKKPS